MSAPADAAAVWCACGWRYAGSGLQFLTEAAAVVLVLADQHSGAGHRVGCLPLLRGVVQREALALAARRRGVR